MTSPSPRLNERTPQKWKRDSVLPSNPPLTSPSRQQGFTELHPPRPRKKHLKTSDVTSSLASRLGVGREGCLWPRLQGSLLEGALLGRPHCKIGRKVSVGTQRTPAGRVDRAPVVTRAALSRNPRRAGRNGGHSTGAGKPDASRDPEPPLPRSASGAPFGRAGCSTAHPRAASPRHEGPAMAGRGGGVESPGGRCGPWGGCSRREEQSGAGSQRCGAGRPAPARRSGNSRGATKPPAPGPRDWTTRTGPATAAAARGTHAGSPRNRPAAAPARPPGRVARGARARRGVRLARARRAAGAGEAAGRGARWGLVVGGIGRATGSRAGWAPGHSRPGLNRPPPPTPACRL